MPKTLSNNHSEENLKTPEGESAEKIDGIILMKMWADYFSKKGKNIIYAGMGHPTFGVNPEICNSSVKFWKDKKKETKQIDKEVYDFYHHYIIDASETMPELGNKDFGRKRMALWFAQNFLWKNHPEYLKQSKKLFASAIQTSTRQPIDVLCAPTLSTREDKESASAENTQGYDADFVKPDNIIVTIGGSSGLYLLFKILNQKNPEGYFITPFPHYTLYFGNQFGNKLIPIDRFLQPGYKLTAAALKENFEKAEKEGKTINGIILCNPDNPTGSMISNEDWVDIFSFIIEKNCFVIVDEAYADLAFEKDKNLVLNILNNKDYFPSEKVSEYVDKVVILRSGTKGMSASGERMAFLVIFNQWLKTQVEHENEKIGKLSTSLQYSYARAFHHNEEQLKKLPSTSMGFLKQYYFEQVQYMAKSLESLGLQMPDSEYKVDGTFYILANMNFLIGMNIEEEVLNTLKQVGLTLKNNKINTDQDIAFYLLVKYNLMIIPLSYFNGNATKGYIRITCSGAEDILKAISDILKTVKESVAAQAASASSLIGSLKPYNSSSTSSVVEGPLYAKSILPNNDLGKELNTFVAPYQDFIKYILAYWYRYQSKSSQIQNIIEEEFKKQSMASDCLAQKIDYFNMFSISSKISSIKGAIDYGTPEGDLENREKMAKGLIAFYGMPNISHENILFVACNGKVLLEKTFNSTFSNINDVPSLLNEVPSPAKKFFYFNVCEYNQAKRKDKEDILKKMLRILTSKDNILILDDTLSELYIEENSVPLEGCLVSKIVHDDQNNKEQIIVLKASDKLFSPQGDQITVCVVFNKHFKMLILNEALNINVHAPRSLQYAFANAYYNFMVRLQSDLTKHECRLYLRSLREFTTTIAEKEMQGLIQLMSSEKINELYMQRIRTISFDAASSQTVNTHGLSKSNSVDFYSFALGETKILSACKKPALGMMTVPELTDSGTFIRNSSSPVTIQEYKLLEHTPLADAIRRRDTETFESLLEKDCNTADKYNRTPLMVACTDEHEGSLEVVVRLLDAGAILDLSDDLGNNCLHYCASYNRHDIVKILKKHNPEKYKILVASLNVKGETPVKIAENRNCTKLLKIFKLSDKKQAKNDTDPSLADPHSLTQFEKISASEGGFEIPSGRDESSTPIINGGAERGKSPAESSIRSATPASSSGSRDYASPFSSSRDYASPFGSSRDYASPFSSSRDYASPLGSASCSPVPGSPEQNLPLIGYPNVSTREIPSSTRAFHDLNMASKRMPSGNIQAGGALSRGTSASAFKPPLLSSKIQSESVGKPEQVKRALKF